MVDYISVLKEDLVEQFRGKPNIEALVEVIGIELQQVADFYEQLRTERDLDHAVGKQLDGVGDIVVMTRKEAGELAGDPIPFDVIDDDTYRQYLIYKILKNTCDCTYPDIIKAFKMFWDYPLYYTEDPEQPATMIFDTGELPGNVDTTPLFKTPLIRAAGVTLKLYARTSVEMDTAWLRIRSGLGYAVTVTTLPTLASSTMAPRCGSAPASRPSRRTRFLELSVIINSATSSVSGPVSRAWHRVISRSLSGRFLMPRRSKPAVLSKASWKRQSTAFRSRNNAP